MRDFYDDYGEPENRARIRDRQLEKLNQRPARIPGGPPMTPETRARLAQWDRDHEGMIDAGGAFPVSRVLLEKFPYARPRPKFEAGDDARGSGNDD
jgi:hypothetical protein